MIRLAIYFLIGLVLWELLLRRPVYTLIGGVIRPMMGEGSPSASQAPRLSAVQNTP